MNPVGDETRRQLVAREQALHDVVVTVELQRTTVAQMRAKARPRAHGFVDLSLAGVRVPERNMDTRPRDRRDELGAARPLRRERDEPDAPAGRSLQPVKFRERRRVLRRGRMRAAKSLHRTQPRPFQVITKNRRTRRRRLGAPPFKSLESPAERVHLVGDERRKNPRRPAAAQRSDRVLKLRPGEPVALEINAAEAVDLKIE